MIESNLRFYSIGIVVETKPVGTDIILVSPIETLSIQNHGDIKSNSMVFQSNLKNIDNVGINEELKAGNYLRAKWLPIGQSNRITAPDVVANETVILFKYENVDEYYWTTLFREVELRRLEKVLYAYSNIRKGISAFDKTTSYWYEVDTKNKYIHLHTSMNDGEYTEYDIDINTKDGNITITDKKNNYIFLDSNKDLLKVNINKDVIVDSGKTITCLAGESITAKAGKTIYAEAGNSITAKAGNSITAEAGNSVTVNAGSSCTINSPSITLNGDVVITKSLTVNSSTSMLGGLSASGGGSMSGDLSVDGNINSTGSIMDTAGNSNHHSHP